MRSLASVCGSLVLAACAGRGAQASEPVRAVTDPAPAERATDDGVVRWAELREQLAALVCIAKIDVPDEGEIEVPIHGERNMCGLPPAATPVERAVDRAWAAAQPMLASMSHSTYAVLERAMRNTLVRDRVGEMRRKFLSERVVGVLMVHLGPALAAEGLRCIDCPSPQVPRPRTIEWDAFAPYLAAHIWPDPVVTPRDAKGRPTGKPTYSVHVCAGINGIGEIRDADPALIELGYLAASQTGLLLERAQALFKEMLRDPAFARLGADDDRTRWLRAEMGARLLADASVRAAVCETVARFRGETGISIARCEPASER